MEMSVIDRVQAYTLEVGDYILFDGVVCAIKEMYESVDDIYVFISEDDREQTYFWWSKVDVYGYADE